MGPWRPAGGTFPGWPTEAKAITMLDPCCGSGHFLTEALAILAALRQAEEHVSSSDAVATVLRDNLHGLEIDGRCVQIAAFAVALSAWRIGGWQTLPLPHIAWVGAPPPLPKREFITLADGDAELEYALAALHDLFVQAPALGTLLEPSGRDLFEAEKLREIERLLEPLLDKARKAEPEILEGVVAASGMADAARMLLRASYTLQATNVPFLGRGKQAPPLQNYVDKHFEEGSADLATAMVLRMIRLQGAGGVSAFVSPQNWTFLKSFRELRKRIWVDNSVSLVAEVGVGSFWTPMYDFSFLLFISERSNPTGDFYPSLVATEDRGPENKEQSLKVTKIERIQRRQVSSSPDLRILTRIQGEGELLSKYVSVRCGLQTGDNDRFISKFWEIPKKTRKWEFFQRTASESAFFDGIENIIRWDQGSGDMVGHRGFRDNGSVAIVRSLNRGPGFVVHRMGRLPASLSVASLFDQNGANPDT